MQRAPQQVEVALPRNRFVREENVQKLDLNVPGLLREISYGNLERLRGDGRHLRAERGRGSAIFLHRWRRPGYPTEGCIAFHPEHLRRIIGLIRYETRLIVPATLL